MALRGEALRNLARSLFTSFYERGLSANEALRQLREQGLGYRRQDFLRDYREGHARYRQEILIRFVRTDAVPSDNIFRPVYHGVPDKYAYLVEWSHRNVETGSIDTGHAWYFTDYKGTKGEIQERIGLYFMGRGKYHADGISVKLKAAHINPYWEEF